MCDLRRSGMDLTSIFDAITRSNNEGLRELIARGRHCNVLNAFFHSPLSHAVARGNLDAMRILLEAGVVAAEPKISTCPLYCAVVTQNLSAIELLLDYGEDADRRDEMGGNLLFECASRSSPAQVVRLLVQRGASVNCVNRDGNSPLVVASGLSLKPMMATLLELGADVCHKNNQGQSALHWAALESDLECIELLLRAGADPTLRTNDDGLTVAEFALRHSVVWTPDRSEEDLAKWRAAISARYLMKIP